MSLIQNSITYAASGQGWLASTDYTALTLNKYLRMVISNPTGSGKTFYIYNLNAFVSSVGGTNLKIYRNPTTTLSGTSVTPLNQHFYDGIFTSVASVNFDTSTNDLSGTVEKFIPQISGQDNNYDNELYVVSAGWSLGISGKALLSTNMLLTIDWVEI